MELLLEPSSAGEAKAVDRRVGIVDGAQGILRGALAAVIECLAEEKEHSPVGHGLLAQEIDREAEGVEDGGAVVSAAEAGDGADCGALVGGEILGDAGRAVEANHSDAIGHVSDEGVEDFGEAAVVVEMRCAGVAVLQEENDGDGLGIVVGLHAEFLRSSVVGEDEVVGGEFKDDFAALGGDERGDEDEVGADGDCGGAGGWGCVRCW